MSRHGYVDDIDNRDLIRWRGAVESAIRGKRGQALLRELLTSLDALPVKELHADVFSKQGCHCALGVVGEVRGLDMSELDKQADDEWVDKDKVAEMFGISRALSAEIMWVNDEGGYYSETPAQRFLRVREWVASKLKESGNG